MYGTHKKQLVLARDLVFKKGDSKTKKNKKKEKKGDS